MTDKVSAIKDVLVFLSSGGDVRVVPSIDNGKRFGMSLSSLMEKVSAIKDVLVVQSIDNG